MNPQYDVVIVGGGVAGALAACRIKTTKPNTRILIIDAGKNGVAGPDRDAFVDAYRTAGNKNVPSPYAKLDNNRLAYAPSCDGAPDPVAMNRYYVETGPDLYESGFQRMLGGSTWAWRGNTPRFLQNDFKLNTLYKVGVDWPITYEDIEPYYIQAERELGVSGNDAEWTDLTPRSAPYPMPGMAPSYGDELVRAALSTIRPIDDVPVTVLTTPQARLSQDYDGRPACQGNSSCLPICPSGAKYDGGVHIAKALGLGVEIRTACVVTRLAKRPGDLAPTVVFKDWSTADKAEQQVDGQHVVLAVNGIETPKLWLLSNLDNTSDQVGRNLMDHLANEVVGLFGQPLYPFRGPQSALGIDTFRDGKFRGNNGAFRMTIGNDGWGRSEPVGLALDHALWDSDNKKIKKIGQPLQQAVQDRITHQLRFSYSTEQLPDPDNRVTLSDERDALDVPRPRITYRIDEYSKRALAYGHSVARRMWQHLQDTARATAVEPLQADLRFLGAGHLMGTMRMGTDKSTSVVDANGRSHDHPGVWVVGSSVFPTAGTANPTLTLAALTLRTADALANTL
ncbi:GMC family oxidoreductase [Kitasatospora sp. NPDC057595]|uniref:GMC family oxidoreductase n=2 Tax=unclassified Kitasatospora TaxID=2633591 RepID=UPI003676BD1B